MEDIAASFVGAAIDGVVKLVGAPIIRQFNYLCCFTTNITALKHEAQKLEDAAQGMQGQVDRARDDVQVILPEVKTWLAHSEAIKDEMNGILNEATNVESGCLKLRARFCLSKRAKKTADRMTELRGQCKFDAISQPGPPPATRPILFGNTYGFESRKQIEQDIMTYLVGGDTDMIGICGMGGLGKTTMAKRIMNRALEEHVFEEVLMVVVSQPVDKTKIQLEIGGSLGLKLEGETSQARVQKLHARLSGTKRILIVLDDIWEKLELEEDFGIPYGSKGCTILLTSRNSDVFRAMSVKKVCGMEVLSEEEAMFFFKERAGSCVDDTRLNSIAEQVVQECRGLPIALTTVGAALNDEKDKRIWTDALTQLREANPANIPDFIAQVYNPLKLSYNRLGSEEAKSVFLLCCLFEEDADISVDLLTYFCMGLCKFEDIERMEGARNRMCTLTKMLKSRSLLLNSDEEDHVRMHDVVRDVRIFIAKQERYIGHNDCTWISSLEFPTRLGFPNLHLLFLSGDSGFKLDTTFFEGIRDLYVLCIQRSSSLTSLPPTTQSLKHLKTLVLDSCDLGLKTISVVGELVNLEILVCRDCSWIEELPPEIKGLNRLKMLELTRCRNLKRIGGGIISSLVGLEELKMLESFTKWDRKGRENAGLRELEALTNLTCLEIDINDPTLAAENMHLSSKLERFIIRIFAVSDNSLPFSKAMCLQLKGETCLGDWIKMQLLIDTESLYLIGDGAANADLTNSQNIRWLEFGECENITMKNIVTVFPHVEHLKLFSLPKLQEIFDAPILSNSFQNLKELSLTMLPVLKQFFKSSTLGQFSQLEILHIQECEMMEQVFLWNEEDENNNNICESSNHHMITIKFPKLKVVALYDLPNLATLYQGIGAIEFPLLTEMSIVDCPKMTSIISTSSNAVTNDDDDCYSHISCQPQKVSFGNLKELNTHWNPFCAHQIPLSSNLNGLQRLTISHYIGSVSLFTSSIARNLASLKELYIWYCVEMIKVIEDAETTTLFPKLEVLQLCDLHKLVSFCECKHDVELPSLRQVEIKRCPMIKRFNVSCAPILEYFTTDLNNHVGVKVPFDRVKQLSIVSTKTPLRGYKSHVSLFRGLEILVINEYSDSMSLLSSTIARNLVSLRALRILYCHKMVKVIQDQGEKRGLVFPKLEELHLDGLPKLVGFCECDVELPSLKELRINRCHGMKDFTLGSVAAPNLKSCCINDSCQEFGGSDKDLNGVLHQHYLERH